MKRMIVRALVALGTAGLLSGCVGALLGGGKPDRLFRFGGSYDQVSTPAEISRRWIALAPVRMPAASAGDRILTVEGTTAAYVRDVRWVSPATFLFQDAVAGALRARIPDLAIGGAARSQAALSVEITRYEADFTGAHDRPVVHLEGTATLSAVGADGRSQRMPISVSVPAADAGIAAVVAAFDAASRNVTVALADWVNRSLPLPVPDKSMPVGRGDGS